MQHATVRNKDDEMVPIISVDYGFFGAPVGAEGRVTRGTGLPILVVFGRRQKSILWAHPVPSKGIEHPHAGSALLKDLEKTGYKRLGLKSDQE